MKTKQNIACGLLSVILALAFVGCKQPANPGGKQPANPGGFVEVTNITGVLTTATVGTPLTLSGTITPSTATNKTIVWSVKSAGATGATLSNGNTLNTTAAGTVTVTATITNGTAQGQNFTKDFTITSIRVEGPPSGEAGIVYVSKDGSPTNSGREYSAPTDIYSAISRAVPGDIIYLLSGIYELSQTIRITNSGTEAAPITLTAYDPYTPFDVVNPLSAANTANRPILNFNSMYHYGRDGTDSSRAGSARGVLHTGDYWHIKGINFTDAGDNGVKLEGSHNVYELCNFWLNGDSGHQISLSQSSNPDFTKGAYNKMINCDSWDNWDPPDWGDADGFACKLYPGHGNEYWGCRSWNNSDDGWDFFNIQTPVVLVNNWTWKNGADPHPGNGNGFKMGGSPSKGHHIMIRNIAWGNKDKGFDQNSNSEGIRLYNNISFNNNRNYIFAIAGDPMNIAYNNVEWGSVGKSAEFRAPYDLQNNSWQLFDNVANPANFTNGNSHADEYIAESITEAAFMAKRKPDGSLPDVMVLKPDSRFRNVGIPYSVKHPYTDEELFVNVPDGQVDLGWLEGPTGPQGEWTPTKTTTFGFGNSSGLDDPPMIEVEGVLTPAWPAWDKYWNETQVAVGGVAEGETAGLSNNTDATLTKGALSLVVKGTSGAFWWRTTQSSTGIILTGCLQDTDSKTDPVFTMSQVQGPFRVTVYYTNTGLNVVTRSADIVVGTGVTAVTTNGEGVPAATTVCTVTYTYTGIDKQDIAVNQVGGNLRWYQVKIEQ